MASLLTPSSVKTAFRKWISAVAFATTLPKVFVSIDTRIVRKSVFPRNANVIINIGPRSQWNSTYRYSLVDSCGLFPVSSFFAFYILDSPTWKLRYHPTRTKSIASIYQSCYRGSVKNQTYKRSTHMVLWRPSASHTIDSKKPKKHLVRSQVSTIRIQTVYIKKLCLRGRKINSPNS